MLPNPALFDACVLGKCVLVIGASGSIGSERCWQVIELVPKRLVMLEMLEFAFAISSVKSFRLSASSAS